MRRNARNYRKVVLTHSSVSSNFLRCDASSAFVTSMIVWPSCVGAMCCHFAMEVALLIVGYWLSSITRLDPAYVFGPSIARLD